jgi:hypothetical protein
MRFFLNGLPPQMIEATNGILVILYAYMAIFAIAYLISVWRRTMPRYGGHYGWLRAAIVTYHEHKPAISIAVIVSGLWMRTAVLWYLRHVFDHNVDPSPWIKPVALPLLWLGTIAAIIGITCWVRVVSPFRYTNAMWVAMTIFAFAFGILMAI